MNSQWFSQYVINRFQTIYSHNGSYLIHNGK